MREIANTLEKSFVIGLRPEPNTPIGAETLVQCYNMVPNGIGLIPRTSPVDFLNDSVSISWPFPVLKAASKGLLLFTNRAVYRIDDGDMHNIGSIATDGKVEIADFGDTILVAGARGYIIVDGVVADLSNAGISFKTCANFKGQAFIGNCSVPDGPGLKGATIVGAPNMVAWSKVNSLDFTFDLGNEAGYAYMPWDGEVWNLKLLGDTVMVYGNGGIGRLEPVREPVASFGFSLFSSFGPISKRAVDGDDLQHLFVGTDYNLYLVEPRKALSDSGYAPKRLGYAEFLEGMRDITVTFDSINRYWWICSKDRAFIFTQHGLGESSEITTGLCMWNSRVGGISKKVGTDEAIIRTSGVSFGTRGIKLLSTVEADIESEAKAFCGIWWISDYTKEYRTPGLIPFDPRGNCFPMVSGSQFEVEIRTGDYRKTALSKIWLRYKVTDKHAVRGVVNAGKIAE